MHIHLDFYTPFIYFHKITVLSREYSVNPTVVMTEMGQMKGIFNMTVFRLCGADNRALLGRNR